jgi:hypothetical protein
MQGSRVSRGFVGEVSSQQGERRVPQPTCQGTEIEFGRFADQRASMGIPLPSRSGNEALLMSVSAVIDGGRFRVIDGIAPKPGKGAEGGLGCSRMPLGLDGLGAAIAGSSPRRDQGSPWQRRGDGQSVVLSCAILLEPRPGQFFGKNGQCSQCSQCGQCSVPSSCGPAAAGRRRASLAWLICY